MGKTNNGDNGDLVNLPVLASMLGSQLSPRYLGGHLAESCLED